MRSSAGLFLTWAVFSAPALAQAPLSAIDWLSDSVDLQAVPTPQTNEAATGNGVGIEMITVTSLDAVSADAVGLLPVSVTGLPKDLWGGTSSAEAARSFAALNGDMLPALQELLFTLLLAELDPPADSDSSGVLFQERVDALLALGAVDQAQALLERAGPDTAPLFRRWFDASLLTGTEDAACARLASFPDLAPTLPVRIFCLARSGDWNAAALTLETGRALDQLTGAEDALLTRFLDADTFEGAPRLPLPSRPSPLVFRLYEAIGEPLPTTSLPLAFANADLNENAGWKAQVEAAERLARSGAIDENQWLGLYTERRPAASGGVWDRVAALQRFDAALTAQDPGAVAASLPGAWRAMQSVGLEVVFARLYGKPLAELSLAGEAAKLAFTIVLLAPGYEAAAQSYAPTDARERFLKALARGDLAGVPAPDQTGTAIIDGFRSGLPAGPLGALMRQGDVGAAIVQAMAKADAGARGNLGYLAEALALFRSVGLEDVARRLALQVMILDQRG
jgi:hypothetical protein